ncbi:ABC transporter ATP-binding protein [Oenococcus sp. UCMA 17063]|nr:ABC transporter ATP-binding protein [Oenococcus sp. UCMA 17063]
MITIQNMTKKFDDRFIFNKLNQTFENGRVYALIGPSGSGKTTLLNILAHLEIYDSGQVFYENKDLAKISANFYFRHMLGYLFQNFGLLENKTVKENLNLGLVGKKFKTNEASKIQNEALKQVHLDYLPPRQKIYALSGGEAQRVALAKVILKDPPLILADEPTAALDPENGQEVMSLLLSLKTRKRTIVIATHNPNVWKMADEIIDLRKFTDLRI